MNNLQSKTNAQNASADLKHIKWNQLAKRAMTDEDAFDELYNHFFPIIYNLIYVRVKNSSVADDIVSDTFLKAFKSLSSFDSKKASFSTWLSRIAMRTLTDYYRWQGHRQGNVEWDDVLSPAAPEHEEPEKQYLAAEGRKDLLLALDKLSERERQIIEMKFWGDMSNKEIAETLELSASNVGVILHRAIGQLKKILGREEE